MTVADDLSSMSLAAPLAGQQKEATARPSGSHRSRLRFVLGLVLLGIVVFLWVFSSVLTQFLYDSSDTNYQKPTALTTLCTATASLFLLPQVMFSSRCPRLLGRQEDQKVERPKLLTVLLISANWYFCQWTFNLSLAHTALATNTMLSSSSVVWGYLFSLLLGFSRLSVFGVASICLAMSGIGLAVLGPETRIDSSAPVDSLWGEGLALGSAIAYGLFSNLLSMKVLPNQMSLVWGGVGLSSLLFGSILMALGHVTGLEPILMPSAKALGVMLLNGVIGTAISDYLFAHGVLLTTPLVANVCLNLTIPMSLVVDTLMLRQHQFTWMSPVGGMLVASAVIAGALDEVCSGRLNESAVSTEEGEDICHGSGSDCGSMMIQSANGTDAAEPKRRGLQPPPLVL